MNTLDGRLCSAREVIWKLVCKTIIRRTLGKDNILKRKVTSSKWKINYVVAIF